MSNPFEDDTARYVVLVNHEGQHSLWPTFTTVPEGWRHVFGPDSREECLGYVEKNWTDLRPKSLIEAMNQSGTGV
jgi:MbtH protein